MNRHQILLELCYHIVRKEKLHVWNSVHRSKTKSCIMAVGVGIASLAGGHKGGILGSIAGALFAVLIAMIVRNEIFSLEDLIKYEMTEEERRELTTAVGVCFLGKRLISLQTGLDLISSEYLEAIILRMIITHLIRVFDCKNIVRIP